MYNLVGCLYLTALINVFSGAFYPIAVAAAAASDREKASPDCRGNQSIRPTNTRSAHMRTLPNALTDILQLTQTLRGQGREREERGRTLIHYLISCDKV